MGISGLLPLLKSIHRPTELRKYAGETFGIDGYGWLHRGAIACALELAQDKPTRKYVDFAMHRVRMFKHFGVTPYLVFDGDYLPSKAKTEESRESRRESSRAIGLGLLKAGKPAQAHLELQKAIDVTPEMTRQLIEELKKAEIPYVVAPYEADAQLVYLERHGHISGIVSEDSDLLVFGAKRLLTKLDQHGQCIEINRRDFLLVREISLTGWTEHEFRHMAILSGCDYLAGINNMGLKTAYRMVRKYKTPERVIKMIQFDSKHRIPENYLADFKQAEFTFLYQRVFCPQKRDIVCLTEPEPSVDVSKMPFIGAPVETELARAIAVGDVNPITKKRILVPTSPSKRRISQTFPSAADTSSRRLGKPIDEYFAGGRRIPLGEMDPNCFSVEPPRNNGVLEAAPRPLVFPLPRPYVDSTEPTTSTARRYTSASSRRKTEPVSKFLGLDSDLLPSNRRRTAGPVVEVFQDASSSTRPPKKARLCEDLPTASIADQTPERSKFFSAGKKKSTREKKTPASEKTDQILMSDDSITEALWSLPDLNCPDSQGKASRGTNEAQLFEEGVAKECTGSITNPEGEVDGKADIEDVEVPASSPRGRFSEDGAHCESISDTPPKGRLQQFCYSSAHPNTRIVHGLPTPSSSTQTTASPRSTPPNRTITPFLTPLQRIGAQALQRGKPRSMLSASRKMKSPKARESFDSLPVNPAFIPLPKVDIEEVKALNRPLGSEDQIIPDSDEENDPDASEDVAGDRPASSKRLNLSRFLYA